MPKSTKVDLLRRIDEAARSSGKSVVQVSASYADSHKDVLVANTDGLLTGDAITRCMSRISVVADGDTGCRPASSRSGTRLGSRPSTGSTSRRWPATRRGWRRRSWRRSAPSGTMPVVIKRGSGGVLFHEACGHGLEADAIAKGASVYAGKVGEQVASSNVTLIDDGTMAGEWGTLGFDDEGHATQRNVLIENGVLTDYMWDFIRARKEDKPFRGNGRRESYRHLPMVRMTNTYVLGGPDDEEEIVRFTDYGVYVAELGGGRSTRRPATSCSACSRRTSSRTARSPCRCAKATSSATGLLRDIDMIAGDFAMGRPGTCGKDGQGVPVGDGRPTLRVKALTVGGTAAERGRFLHRCERRGASRGAASDGLRGRGTQ